MQKCAKMQKRILPPEEKQIARWHWICCLKKPDSRSNMSPTRILHMLKWFLKEKNN